MGGDFRYDSRIQRACSTVDTRSRVSPGDLVIIPSIFYMKLDLGFWGRLSRSSRRLENAGFFWDLLGDDFLNMLFNSASSDRVRQWTHV